MSVAIKLAARLQHNVSSVEPVVKTGGLIKGCAYKQAEGFLITLTAFWDLDKKFKFGVGLDS